jgi:hypothetical protein
LLAAAAVVVAVAVVTLNTIKISSLKRMKTCILAISFKLDESIIILGLGESGGIIVVFSVETSVGKALSLLFRVSYSRNTIINTFWLDVCFIQYSLYGVFPSFNHDLERNDVFKSSSPII